MRKSWRPQDVIGIFIQKIQDDLVLTLATPLKIKLIISK